MVLAGPEHPLATPTGLAQFDAFIGQESRQRQADGLDEILVADDAYLTTVRAGSVVFEISEVGVFGVSMGEAVDHPQVERGELLLLLFDDADQYRVGLGLVFLHRAGQRVARQIDQAVQ